jgi:ribosomal protein S18 acetylase RimI-like enzyme
VPDHDIEIRELRLPEDGAAVRELDTSFTTDVVYDVVRTGDSFRLAPTRVAPAVTKRFPLDDLDDDAGQGHLAVAAGRACGLLVTGYERWNRRLVIRHLYVHSQDRRRGVGRCLVERALHEAAAHGARTVWLETSSLNYPGVQAYLRLGFELCGLDTTLYRGTPSEGETALFLARSLAR